MTDRLRGNFTAKIKDITRHITSNDVRTVNSSLQLNFKTVRKPWIGIY